MATTLSRFLRVSLPLLLLFVTLSPLSPVLADDDIQGLNQEEEAYVANLRAVYGIAETVTQEIDEHLSTGAFEKALTTDELEPSFVTTQLAAANSLLAGGVARLQEDPPKPLAASLRDINPEVAEVFAEGYTPCQWSEGVMGGPSGSIPADTATVGRILACIAGQNAKIRKAASEGSGALEARVAKIQREEELEIELLGEQGASICFIATAAYGTPSAEEIDVLRNFRDDVLLKSEAGRDYVSFYYAVSPPFADFIARHERLRTLVRELAIDPIVWAVRTASFLWSAP